jgi:hypothetical protein
LAAGGPGSRPSSASVEAQLPAGEESKTLVVKFDAWLYQGFDDARAALMEVMSSALLERAENDKTFFEKAKEFAGRVNYFLGLGMIADFGVGMAFGIPPDLCSMPDLARKNPSSASQALCLVPLTVALCGARLTVLAKAVAVLLDARYGAAPNKKRNWAHVYFPTSSPRSIRIRMLLHTLQSFNVGERAGSSPRSSERFSMSAYFAAQSRKVASSRTDGTRR